MDNSSTINPSLGFDQLEFFLNTSKKDTSSSTSVLRLNKSGGFQSHEKKSFPEWKLFFHRISCQCLFVDTYNKFSQAQEANGLAVQSFLKVVKQRYTNEKLSIKENNLKPKEGLPLEKAREIITQCKRNEQYRLFPKRYKLIFSHVDFYCSKIEKTFFSQKLDKLNLGNETHLCSVCTYLQKKIPGWEELSIEVRNKNINDFLNFYNKFSCENKFLGAPKKAYENLFKEYREACKEYRGACKEYKKTCKEYEKACEGYKETYVKYKKALTLYDEAWERWKRKGYFKAFSWLARHKDECIWKLCKGEKGELKDQKAFKLLVEYVSEVKSSQLLLGAIKQAKPALLESEVIEHHDSIMARRGMHNGEMAHKGINCCMNAPIIALRDELIALLEVGDEKMLKSAMTLIGGGYKFPINQKPIPFEKLTDNQKDEIIKSDKGQILKHEAKTFVKHLKPILTRLKARFDPARFTRKNLRKMPTESWHDWEVKQDKIIRQSLTNLGCGYGVLSKKFLVKNGEKTQEQDDASIFYRFLLRLLDRPCVKAQSQNVLDLGDKMEPSQSNTSKVQPKENPIRPLNKFLFDSTISVLPKSDSKEGEASILNQLLLEETVNTSPISGISLNPDNKNDKRRFSGERHQTYTQVPKKATIIINRFKPIEIDENGQTRYEKDNSQVKGIFGSITLSTGVYDLKLNKNKLTSSQTMKARTIVVHDGESMKGGHYSIAEFVEGLGWVYYSDHDRPSLLNINNNPKQRKRLEKKIYLVETCV